MQGTNSPKPLAISLDLSHLGDQLDNASMAAGKKAVLFDDIIQAGEL